MCVVSMVSDFYWPRFPNPSLPLPQQIDPVELQEQIKKFWEALEAAKKVDILTDQPDCVVPEKAKLEARVAELEKIVDDLLKNKKKKFKKSKKK